jgi:hypothetical protein
VEFGQPRLVSTAFTPEEDALINQKILEMESRWALIAGMRDMRTANKVKHWWKMLTRRARNRICAMTTANRR